MESICLRQTARGLGSGLGMEGLQPHFTEEKTEAHRGSGTCPGSALGSGAAAASVMLGVPSRSTFAFWACLLPLSGRCPWCVPIHGLWGWRVPDRRWDN